MEQLQTIIHDSSHKYPELSQVKLEIVPYNNLYNALLNILLMNETINSICLSRHTFQTTSIQSFEKNQFCVAFI